jgi:hypothetical protein
MQVASLLVCLSLIFFQSTPQTSTPVLRDPQAVAILQHSIAALARTSPADSSAVGTVTVVEGSTTQSGPIQILTRGVSQTMETMNLPDGQRSVVYSNGDAKEVSSGQASHPPLELIVIDQCPDFPLPLLLSALSDSDKALFYIGQETLNGNSVEHIQMWNAFSSNAPLQRLAPFSIKDIWFDASSGMPLKIAYYRRTGSGAVPSVAVEVFFSNYKNLSGVLYPFQINKSYNGTPWATITIHSVTFDNALTDSDFPVH